MKRKESFQKTVIKLALPVTLQSLLQSSFSVIDQIMIGRLGSNSIAGIGLGGKFASLYSVVLASVATAAGIMISQYIGKKDEASISRSFLTSALLSLGLAALFLLPGVGFPGLVMKIYTKDMDTLILAADYLRIFSLSFLPMAVNSVVTTLLRCMEAASLPLYANIFALALNTGLNYLLIFGKGGFPEMGVKGAALASVIAQLISCLIIIFLFERYRHRQNLKLHLRLSSVLTLSPEYCRQYLRILSPLLICEFLWSLGENVYAAIYGNMGTDTCAAMTMTVPVQTLFIGALSGLSQASSILIGKFLGKKNYEQAYAASKKLMKYGLYGSLLLSLLLISSAPFYVKIYQVEPGLQNLTGQVLRAFALIAPVKVLNMILGGGIIRSGGKTRYIMWVDIIGTWGFGVPLGLISAFVLKLPIPSVYFILSLEECVRLGITILLFKKRVWMESL